jgi:hypothetical protein
MFAILDKERPNTGNITGLNLARRSSIRPFKFKSAVVAETTEAKA